MAAPSVRVVGAWAASLTALTVNPNASHVSGDAEYMFIEHSGEASMPVLTTANGFVQMTGGQVNVNGTAIGANTSTLTIFWRRWNGTNGSPVVTDTGNHQQGIIISVSGAIASGNPFEAVTTSTATAAGTSGSITGGTSLGIERLILAGVGASLPDAISTTEYSAWANANLGSVTERSDNTTDAGSGGGLGTVSGTLATASAWGATTFTSVTSSHKAMISFAIPPVASAAADMPYRNRTYAQILPQ